ncbi:hypothetical protein [Roseibium sp.]|uniref:hypothetical protein n=1 Tax=Roseibium sp. TaxID=1936156 RepID=UPI001B2E6AE1|nr:hypothetical protein [Roseibium sp.]MBO6858809.1 DUF4276 family protein [Roseibium sp.]
MHFEILVEDISGKVALEHLFPKIASAEDTFNIHPYKGLGRIPKNIFKDKHPKARILLEQLPRLLRAYGKTHANYPDDYLAAVVVVCDLDQKDFSTFLKELNNTLQTCLPAPITRFCIAIEEGEAWLLGDLAAIKAAYPAAKKQVLDSYVNDSICGTWEVLADAVYQGGATALKAKGSQAIGQEKSRWAENICPNMDIDTNNSPSFIHFREAIRNLG